MMMQKINPEWLPAPRGYNHGLVAPAGKLVFVAGQIGWDKFGKMTEGLVNQFHRAIQNVMEVVKGAGGTPESVGHMTIYIKNKKEYLDQQKALGPVWRTVMGKHFPAMSLVVVQDLLDDKALVEIEAMAVIG
jgi:enamine deaminase RidA (YjgF/YER057c/UK114 family)